MLVSPPGWYWYGPEPPSFHGSLSVAFATVRSDEALVGERAMDNEHMRPHRDLW